MPFLGGLGHRAGGLCGSTVQAPSPELGRPVRVARASPDHIQGFGPFGHLDDAEAVQPSYDGPTHRFRDRHAH
eukprot:4261222-Prorocentrum_lima.AAC.1